MVKDYSKTSKTSSKPPVRQVKGPGMNMGMKKPRRVPAQPKDYTKPSAKSMRPAFTGAYLPWDTLGGKESKP